MSTAVVVPLTTGATTNLTRLSGSGAKLSGIEVTNTAAYAIFVKLWWGNTIPVVGTTVPTLVITCPAAATSGGGTGRDWSSGITGNGQLWCWVTKLAGVTDTTATVAGDGIIAFLVE